MEKKGNAWALLPILVFLVLFIGVGIVSGDFYAMPITVGFLIALVVAFVQNPKKTFDEKLSIMAKGAGEENIMIMCLIFILAGAFAGAVQAAGGVDSTVNLGLSFIPARFAVAGLFVIGCFISISMGTSMGTIAALAPIAVGVSEKTGISSAICMAAVIGGAVFGDNLSVISDTTIAAARTQGCEMRDKFRVNVKIVWPGALITVIIFLVLTWNVEVELEAVSYNLFQVLPYIFVLIGALAGINVFIVLISGTVIALLVGVATQQILPMDIFSVVGNGMADMFEITILSLLVAGVVELIKDNGGIDFIIYTIRKHIKTKRGSELGIACLASLVDCATANNTVAIVIAGPIAKEIADEYDIDPKRVASTLDIFAAAWQGIIPYGAQLLAGAQAASITPLAIIPYLFYPFLMGISGVISIFIEYRRRAS